ncbi:MAG TPA: aa3-type cytochrome c oxidase subunit IV [Hyphomicrobiaceae bacterium]|nr:aa3-type cytochrome c oxidase subunit IV [Hyphomicrobiaceae bacterium]
MSVDTTSGNPSMDYREHERTYAGFVFMTKVLVSAAVLLLIGMALFLL